LGTKFTIEMGFYIDKLKEYGIEAIIPNDKKDIEIIQILSKMNLAKEL